MATEIPEDTAGPSLAYRPAREPDWFFVVDSWLWSYRDAHAAGLIQMEDWNRVMKPQLAKVLARSGVSIFVAHHPGQDGTGADLYGWIAIERGYQTPARSRQGGRWVDSMVSVSEPLVHYVFVKQPYRRLGIARGLFKAAGVDPAAAFNYTAKTAIVTLLADKISGGRWMPLIARYAK